MGVSIYNIKKWTKMVLGKSIMHVDQGVGKIYSKERIAGYYNDLTEKVTKDTDHYNIIDVFPHKSETASEGVKDVYFPIALFQYGLGAYDLYLINKDELMLEKFRKHVEWAMDNQQEDGSWDNFGFIYPEYKYSAMAQGEGCSLLLRAYVQFQDKRYLNAAKKAIDFMLKPVDQGGTTKYEGEDVILLEYTHLPVVMNGWIFAMFGLFDFVLQTNNEHYKEILRKTVRSLEARVEDFDCKYWTYYDGEKKIASPFYHHLHIAQLRVLYDLFSREVFSAYANRWEGFERNKLFVMMAFMKKAIQKIRER